MLGFVLVDYFVKYSSTASTSLALILKTKCLRKVRIKRGEAKKTSQPTI